MINWQGWASQFLPLGGRRSARYLARLERNYAAYLPLVAGLGFISSLLETVGIGLLIPLVGLAFSNAMPAGLPGPLNWLVAMLGPAGSPGTVMTIGAVILLLVLLKGAAQAANAWLIAALEGRMGRDVRNALAARVLDLDYPFFLRNDSTRIVNVMATDSWNVITAYRWYLSAVPAVIGLAVFTLFMVWLEWRLAVLVLASAVAIRGLLQIFERRVRRHSVTATAATKVLLQRMLTIVDAIRVVRIFDQQDQETRKFAAASEQVRLATFATQRLSAALAPSVDVLVTALFVVAMLAAYRVGLSLAEASAFLVVLTRAQPYAKTISQARLGIASVQGSIESVEWLLSRRPELSPPVIRRLSFALDRPVHFRQVSFAYPDGSHAISDASFTLEPGTATAVIGPSGSGKSTLVNLLTLLIEPQSGDICFGDTPMKQINPRDWRSCIAIAGQDAGIFDGTVAEAIAYARPDASPEEIESAARAANAHDFIAGLPFGYATPLDYGGANLSGGQRQRLALARALLRNPDLLILDEATSAVDAISEQEMMRLLAGHRRFRTALVISHRRSTLAACQNGIVLDNGRILEAGPLRALEYYRLMEGEMRIQ